MHMTQMLPISGRKPLHLPIPSLARRTRVLVIPHQEVVEAVLRYTEATKEKCSRGCPTKRRTPPTPFLKRGALSRVALISHTVWPCLLLRQDRQGIQCDFGLKLTGSYLQRVVRLPRQRHSKQVPLIHLKGEVKNHCNGW